MTTGSNHSLVAVQVIGAPKSAETASQEIVDSMSSDERGGAESLYRESSSHQQYDVGFWRVSRIFRNAPISLPRS